MPKDHVKFHSANGKRLILLAASDPANRQQLEEILRENYEIIFAQTEQEVLKQITEKYMLLSLVMLSLNLPGVKGTSLLKRIKEEPKFSQVPVIVIASERSAEAESLQKGATDFIAKPFPLPEVILARILRTIELSEDRMIIQSTERDSLTGLYNREYFYSYAEQYDQHHIDVPMDAIVLNVNRFQMINERYGKAFGDVVLRRIGERVRGLVRDNGGIVCRREADTFLVYCPHGKNYRSFLAAASTGLIGEEDSKDRVRLRMGVYAMVDKTLDIEQRFDRAKRAADTLRNSFTQSIAIYDNKLHEDEVFTQHLLEDFNTAMEEGQFLVYYQPKFNIQPEVPVLSSAEALVRWNHPTLGMISPALFIPLLENNGLIQHLDQFVWRRVAAQMKDWKERLEISVPVSVNVSRIDMYDPGIIDVFRNLLVEFDLTTEDFLLEITESAYTQNFDQIIETVEKMRKLGFKFEMDDFGTGYSSLHMISSLPIDALKLDMRFIQNAFTEKKDLRMLELILDIANYLAVPVIAEGVETEDQVMTLKSLGYYLIQGFYFSRPQPPEEYERFIVEKKRMLEEAGGPADPIVLQDGKTPEKISYGRVAHALASGFDTVYIISTLTNDYIECSAHGSEQYLEVDRSGKEFFKESRRVIRKTVLVEDRSRVLASLDKENLLREVAGDKRFSLSFRLVLDGETSQFNLKAVRPEGHENLILIGLRNIDALILREKEFRDVKEKEVTYARIALALAKDYFSIYYVDTDTGGYLEYNSNGEFQELQLVEAGENFFEAIQQSILRQVYDQDQEKALHAWNRSNMLRELQNSNYYSTSYRVIRDGKPVYINFKVIRLTEVDDHHIVVGISSIDAQMRREEEFQEVQELALRDALTGVKNKRAYARSESEFDKRIQDGSVEAFAMVVCDMNNLKSINARLGHHTGDEMLKETCQLICSIFQHSPVFRVGGDEFVVILQGQDYRNRQLLMEQLLLDSMNSSRSEGPAFAGGIAEFDPLLDKRMKDIFLRADAAMRQHKISQKTTDR